MGADVTGIAELKPAPAAAHGHAHARRSIAVAALLLCLCPVRVPAQEFTIPPGVTVEASGTLKEKDPRTGHVYQVTLFGALIPGRDRLLSTALSQGRGEYLVSIKGATKLVTTGAIAGIQPGRITLTVGGRRADFVVGPGTRICDGSKPVALATIDRRKLLTVTTVLGSSLALSVRSGPMLFRQGMDGIQGIAAYDCDH